MDNGVRHSPGPNYRLNLNLDFCRRQTIFVKKLIVRGLSPCAAKQLLVIWSGFRPAPILYPTVSIKSSYAFMFYFLSQRQCIFLKTTKRFFNELSTIGSIILDVNISHTVVSLQAYRLIGLSRCFRLPFLQSCNVNLIKWSLVPECQYTEKYQNKIIFKNCHFRVDTPLF